MKDIKSFIIGFLTALVILLFLGFSESKLGSSSWNPVYVKIVE
tara:strand:+ start:7322 stop:7450 length:129 start_codon:yes stop_codon:yes gene_type:complete